MSVKLFGRYYLITAGVLVLTCTLGFLATHAVMRIAAQNRGPRPAEVYAEMIAGIPAPSRVAILERISPNGKFGPGRIFLVNDQGQTLYPSNQSIPFEWEKAEKPAAVEEEITVEPRDGRNSRIDISMLPGENIQYLVTTRRSRFGGPPGFFRFLPFLLVLASALVGSGGVLYFMFRNLRHKIQLADGVIDQLYRGNLKARFPVEKGDETGKIMLRFNSMADEIERLIDRLTAAEKTRSNLLQELAHDLRTPIASLKNLLETLESRPEAVTKELQAEFLSLSLKEVDYFERLVEDLLFLAQVSEPKYEPELKNFSLSEQFQDIASRVARKYQGTKHLVHASKEVGSDISLSADAHLTERLFTNALENAFRFATHTVTISSQRQGDDVTFTVEDDGPGMTKEELKAYGHRRVSRAVTASRDGRVSVGLGSVIMKTILKAHRGELLVKNIEDGQGQVQGTRVELHFLKPLS